MGVEALVARERRPLRLLRMRSESERADETSKVDEVDWHLQWDEVECTDAYCDGASWIPDMDKRSGITPCRAAYPAAGRGRPRHRRGARCARIDS